jgi:hypothetical protein
LSQSAFDTLRLTNSSPFRGDRSNHRRDASVHQTYESFDGQSDHLGVVSRSSFGVRTIVCPRYAIDPTGI